MLEVIRNNNNAKNVNVSTAGHDTAFLHNVYMTLFGLQFERLNSSLEDTLLYLGQLANTMDLVSMVKVDTITEPINVNFTLPQW